MHAILRRYSISQSSARVVRRPMAIKWLKGIARDSSRDRGLVIVSGLARGIDCLAHRGACSSARGATIGVLGTGIDVIYPKENKKVFAEVEKHGALISEFPLGSHAAPENFPVRNRIVAGMSLGTVVVEGEQYSGSLITGAPGHGIRPRSIRRARKLHATFQLRTESTNQAGRETCYRMGRCSRRTSHRNSRGIVPSGDTGGCGTRITFFGSTCARAKKAVRIVEHRSDVACRRDRGNIRHDFFGGAGGALRNGIEGDHSPNAGKTIRAREHALKNWRHQNTASVKPEGHTPTRPSGFRLKTIKWESHSSSLNRPLRRKRLTNTWDAISASRPPSGT